MSEPNTAPRKLVRKLRHFGLDYLTLNIGYPYDFKGYPDSIRFLDQLFDLPHNETNASDYKDIIWGAGPEEVNIYFSSYGNDPVIRVHRGEDHIMMIRQIGPTSNMPPGVKRKYRYQIQFYGWFFGLVRLGSFSITDYLHIFLKDIEAKQILTSVSRIDICADIEAASVVSIERSIVKKGRMKARSKLEFDAVTNQPATITFGSRAQDWKARIYDKIKEITAKHKESLYPDYIASSCISRLEIELHSQPCQEFEITLKKALDLGFLLTVYVSFLNTKSARWRITKFIQKELEKRGTTPIPAERIKISYEQLSQSAYFKRTVNHVLECAKRYGFKPRQVIDRISTLIETSSN